MQNEEIMVATFKKITELLAIPHPYNAINNDDDEMHSCVPSINAVIKYKICGGKK